MASGADRQTDRHTRIPTRGPKQFQENRRARPKAARAWFKNETSQNKLTLLIMSISCELLHLLVALDILICATQHLCDYAPHCVLSDVMLTGAHWQTGVPGHSVGFLFSGP